MYACYGLCVCVCASECVCVCVLVNVCLRMCVRMRAFVRPCVWENTRRAKRQNASHPLPAEDLFVCGMSQYTAGHDLSVEKYRESWVQPQIIDVLPSLLIHRYQGIGLFLFVHSHSFGSGILIL